MTERPSLLVVEDDDALRARLARALHAQGFEVRTARDLAQAHAVAEADPPEHALVDLRLPDGSGLDVLRHLKALDAQTNVVMLTGWASIPTAMEAVRLGATHYVSKPAGASEIVAALARRPGESFAPVTLEDVPTLEVAEWEHIQRVLDAHGGNITHAAAALGLHRRSLQRKLARRPTRG